MERSLLFGLLLNACAEAATANAFTEQFGEYNRLAGLHNNGVAHIQMAYSAMASGDLNGDGRPDLLVGRCTSTKQVNVDASGKVKMRVILGDTGDASVDCKEGTISYFPATKLNAPFIQSGIHDSVTNQPNPITTKQAYGHTVITHEDHLTGQVETTVMMGNELGDGVIGIGDSDDLPLLGALKSANPQGHSVHSRYPCPAIGDLNGDGLNDILVGHAKIGKGDSGSYGHGSSRWPVNIGATCTRPADPGCDAATKVTTIDYYRNVGTTTAPNFVRVKADGSAFTADGTGESKDGDPFLTLEFGEYGVCPHLVDYNGDGLLDLVTSEAGGLADGLPAVRFFPNCGTKSNPKFATDANGAGCADTDAGKPLECSYLTDASNNARDRVPDGGMASAAKSDCPLGKALLKGDRKTLKPVLAFADLNGDKLPDLLLGTYDPGRGIYGVDYFLNTGSSTQMVLTKQTTGNPLAGVNVGSRPFMVIDNFDLDPHLELMLSTKGPVIDTNPEADIFENPFRGVGGRFFDVVCPVGTYGTAGSTWCTNCPAGLYGTQRSLSGTADQSLSVACARCPAGTDSKVVGATSVAVCVLCPAATQRAGGQAACAPCSRPAIEIVNPLRTSCTECKEGYFTLEGSCTLCKEGTFRQAGMAGCIRCPVSTITADGKACAKCVYPLVPNLAQTACQPCGDGTRPSNGVCVTCPTVDRGLSCNGGQLLLEEGFWHDQLTGLTNESRVIQCVFEGACKVNTSIQSAQLLSTSLDSDDPVMYCADGYRGLLCADCVSGFYRSKEGCMECPAGAGATMATIFLAPAGIISAVCMAVVLCLSVLAFRAATKDQVRAATKDHETAKAANENIGAVAEGQLKGVHDDVGAAFSKTSMFDLIFRVQQVLGNKGKIILSYVQIIVLFRIELPALAWPNYLDGLFSFFNVLNFDVLKVVPLGCSTESLAAPFATTFAINVYGSLGIIVSILLVGLVSGAVLFRGPLVPAGRLWRAFCIKWFGIVIFLQYTPICQIIIQAIRPCVAIDGNDADPTSISTRVMRADVTLSCDTPEYQSLRLQGFVAFLLFCIGVPLILLIQLRRNRAVLYCYARSMAVDRVGYFIGGEGDLKGRLLRTMCRTELHMGPPPKPDSADVVTPIAGQPYTLLGVENEDADDDTTIFKFTGGLNLIKIHDEDCKIEAAHLAFGWVSSNYDSTAYWFEPWEFLRKLILTVVAIFGATDSNLQIVYALIVCTMCLLFQAEMQPYADDGDDFLGAVSLACLSMTLTVGLGLAVPTADQTVRWMLELLAVLVSVFALLLGIYQFMQDSFVEFGDNKDAADSRITKCCGCKTDASRAAEESRAAEDIAEVMKKN